MRRVYLFLKSTILGGLLVLVPLLVLGAVTAWIAASVMKLLSPMMEWLPDRSVSGISLAAVLAASGMIACCFVAGLFAETALLRFFGDRAERIAIYVPGYALMKSAGANLVGIQSKNTP